MNQYDRKEMLYCVCVWGGGQFQHQLSIADLSVRSKGLGHLDIGVLPCQIKEGHYFIPRFVAHDSASSRILKSSQQHMYV